MTCDIPAESPSCQRQGRRLATSTTLKALRTNRALRILAGIVTLIWWFVLSNHCALGGIGSRAAAQNAHACCHHGASQPVKESGDGEGKMGCCKSLHAVMPDDAKLADVPPPLGVSEFVPWVLIRDAQPQAVIGPFGATGPPRAESFTELVLHRSLPSHAPPFVV